MITATATAPKSGVTNYFLVQSFTVCFQRTQPRFWYFSRGPCDRLRPVQS